MDLTDRELFALLKQQDENALAALYDRYGALAYSIAYRVLESKEAAEEVVQDVFMSVWNNPSTWNPSKGKLISWLATVTRNRAIDRLRKDQRRTDTTQGTSLEDLPSLSAHRDRVGDPLWADGLLLRELMNRLPDEQQQMIEYAYFKGLTHRAISEATQIPLGTVKTRLRSGLQKLRQLWAIEDDMPASEQDET